MLIYIHLDCGEAIVDLVPSLGARAKDKVAAAKRLKAFDAMKEFNRT